MLLPEALLVFFLGLIFGSFLNLLIDRIPRNESVIRGRSHCDYCKKELGIIDLIPIISYIFLKGRCRFCKRKISSYNPLVEIITAVLFIFAFLYVNAQINPSPAFFSLDLI